MYCYYITVTCVVILLKCIYTMHITYKSIYILSQDINAAHLEDF